MLDKFLVALGEKTAERWMAVSVPALVFWLAGAAAWLWRYGLGAIDPVVAWLGAQTAVVQVGSLVVALLVVSASGVAVGALSGPLLRLLQGDSWPAWLKSWGAARHGERCAVLIEEWDALSDPVLGGTATPQQEVRFAELDRKLRRYPDSSAFLPTRVGNILRAAEHRAQPRYGLDTSTVWSHLWLLLPEPIQKGLARVRTALDDAVAMAIWGVLFVAFTPLAWWAAAVGLSCVVLAVTWLVPLRAEAFADLVEAAFDLYRAELYTQLRWPLPTDPDDERVQGARLTEYVLRGLTGSEPTFTSGTTDVTN
ncbi:hypothetical protein [Cellulomonas sp. Leaf334]|uniref:hypothetical protein n=1 Tax=Cellulomonas sp. Leaf334 TaxID=1736339 RepID=UPI0006FC3B76|nr:hypothetical protein [Cellulomonas sp. Leaf334]KQR10404.1 hypothetical protein ASF78_17095 [Cellulomonas sp. Leaf334]